MNGSGFDITENLGLATVPFLELQVFQLNSHHKRLLTLEGRRLFPLERSPGRGILALGPEQKTGKQMAEKKSLLCH